MTDVSEPDESLMVRYQHGDEAAFQAIFARYTAPLIHFAYRFIGSHVEAEDLVQEVFLRVYRHTDRYDANRPFRSWIFSITARLAMNKARDRKTHQETPLETTTSSDEQVSAVSFQDHTSLQPEMVHESQVRVREIRSALQELPENQRIAVLLCRFEEMSYEEISLVMSTSIQSVKSLIYRGMQTLGNRLLPSSAQLSESPRVLDSEGGN